MIFYFSGTGNSAVAAKQLRREGEQLVSIASACGRGTFDYAAAEGEPIGFVFPVYFYGLPDLVRTFAQRVRFAQSPGYVYAVITCGGSIGGAGGLLQTFLAKGGIRLSAVFSVKMPDNYVLLYDVTTQEEEKPILQAAREKLAAIREKVAAQECAPVQPNIFQRAETALIYPFYDITRKTAGFRADDTCTGCGACAARCPSGAIQMRNDKPFWVKEKCSHCLSCIRCSSVQHGKRTVGKYRYMHPSLRK